MNKEPVPSRRGSESAPLDPARLADVLRGCGSSAADFLAQFRRSTQFDADQLLEAAASGDLARVEKLVHRIEGASKVIGARPLAAACSVLGAAARSGQAAGLRPALDSLMERKQALDVFLDAREQADAAPSAPMGIGDANGRQQICAGLVFLVVEDHEFQRGVMMRLLRQLGALKVHGFADGETALAAAMTIQEPAILVLDLAMPGLSGMEVVRIVAQEQLPVAVIINSALSQDLLREPLQTARSYGADMLGALSKPLTAAKLAPLLAGLPHGRQVGTPKPSRVP